MEENGKDQAKDEETGEEGENGKVVRIPSEGQTFKLLGTTFVVRKSSAFWFKAEVKRQ